jgi:hypothetical protein
MEIFLKGIWFFKQSAGKRQSAPLTRQNKVSP